MPRLDPARKPARQDVPVRPGVLIVALAGMAVAAGLLALSLKGSGPTGAETKVVREPRPPAARVQTEVAKSDLPPPLPASTPGWGRPSPAKRPAVRVQAPTAAADAEPQWDGNGPPPRDWLRWQIASMVEQMNPHGSISRNAMESAVDDALEAYAAKRALESASDPADAAAAQERLQMASQNLAATMGVEQVDLSAF